MSEVTSLYIHGLGKTELRPSERMILDRYRRLGIKVIPFCLDWCSEETFPQVLRRAVDQATQTLDSLDQDAKLIIEGSSAGGSLALNAFMRLEDPRARVVIHSGRLHAGSYSAKSIHSLERCAHLGTNRASQSFYDSVTYCEEETIPMLGQEKLSRILITKPLADEVVPVSTMTIAGVKAITVPIVGHSFGIGLGMMLTPSQTHDL